MQGEYGIINRDRSRHGIWDRPSHLVDLFRQWNEWRSIIETKWKLYQR